MKKIIAIISFNIILFLVVICIVNFTGNDIKVSYLKDVSGYDLSSALDYLYDYEINVLYVESDEKESVILYTKPKADSLVYEHQSITLYVSKGFKSEKYKDIKNNFYDDYKSYLDEIIDKYNLKLIINYKDDLYLPDGLIYDFITTSEVVNYGDEIYLTIIRNLKYVILPDFYGWYYEDVLSFLQKNEINVELIYIELFYKEDYVIGQSVDAGSKVLKRSNPVIIYIAKRS